MKQMLVLLEKAQPVSAAEEKEAREKLSNVGLWLSYQHPHFGLAWSRCKGRLTITRALQFGTMAVRNDGAMFADPDFVKTLQPKQLAFVMCHEVLHVAGNHYDRSVTVGVCDSAGKVLDEGRQTAWGLATDMAINYALSRDQVGEMPTGEFEGVMPPPDYKGSFDSESLFVWLMKKAKGGKSGSPTASDIRQAAGLPKQGDVKVLQGCLPGPSDKGQDEKDGEGQQKAGQAPQGGPSIQIPLGDTIRAALSQGIGRGSAVAELLSPKAPRCRWETVLQSGFTTASLEATNRIYKTYARSGRRHSLIPGGIVPGRKGGLPSVALAIDVSGSMDRNLVAQIIGEALQISRLIGAELFLATHTDALTWSGWVKPNDVETVKKACAFTGGTDAGPAYEAIRQAKAQGGFDCLVHFTDTMLPYWPKVPAKRLVVGATGLGNGQGLGCNPPPGAKILRVEV